MNPRLSLILLYRIVDLLYRSLQQRQPRTDVGINRTFYDTVRLRIETFTKFKITRSPTTDLSTFTNIR